MFNFTTQTVYNAINTTGANKNMWVAAQGKKPSLRIGNTRFDKDLILDIQVKNPTVENLASVTFNMADVLIEEGSTEKEKIARIVLYVGLSMNSQEAFYANDFVYKGKPLYVEFIVKAGDTADIVAKRVKANATKYLLLSMGPEKILDITATTAAASGDDPATGTVTFTGVNGYQQIKKASLQVFDPEAKTVDCCSRQGEYIDVKVGVPVVYTTNAVGTVTLGNQKLDESGEKVALEDNEVAIAPGIDAFGDYNWIIHNLRLPTAANTNFWAPTRAEMPVVGQQYTQFIVRIMKERDGISGEIVGARAKSVTTHVLYVAGLKTAAGSAANAVNSAFTTLLGDDAATKILTDADTTLQTPYGA